jgi:hypothetical protein
MSRQLKLVSFFALFLLCLIAVAQGQSSTSRSVNVQELENGVQIIGLLGLPLGELASIEGQIVQSGMKGTDSLIKVDRINGKSVSNSLLMKFAVWQWGNLANRELQVGPKLRIRAYETGGMTGIPIEAMKETVFVQAESWRFETSLVLVNLERP